MENNGKMKFKLDNIKGFKEAIVTAEQMLDEIKFEADTDGVRFRGLDRSHVAFVNMIIRSDYFEEYEIDLPESCIVDSQELVKVLKRSKSDDSLIFSFDESNIKIQFVGKAKRTFKIKQVDMEYDAPSLPNIEYPIEIDVDYKQLQDTVKDAELYSEKVTIATEDQELKIISTGNFGEYVSNIPLLVSLQKCASVFSLDWLKKFFKLSNISDVVTINMGNNMPLFLSFEDEDGLEVDFLLAPRIEEDE